MILKEISVYDVKNNKTSRKFNLETWCISEMYCRYLKKTKNNKIRKINIILGEDSPRELLSFVLKIYNEFDFNQYFEKSTYDKKKIILDVIHKELLSISEEFGFDINVIKEAYNSCLENKLENRWFLKNKLFKSRKSPLLGGIECFWDFDIFRVKAIIFSSKRKILKESLFLEIEPCFGEFIYYAKCRWKDDIFYLESKENEIWQVDCSKILQVE